MHKAAYTGVISVAGPVCGTYFVAKFSQFINEKNKTASSNLCKRFNGKQLGYVRAEALKTLY